MADRFFGIFDREKTGYVEREVLLNGIAHLTEDSHVHKLKFLFHMIDDKG